MARLVDRLNPLQISRLVKAGYYPDGRNLYLQVSPSGSKSWVFRYSFDKRQREMGLGSVSDFSLAEARDRATQQRRLLTDGIDPLTAKRERELVQRLADANVITFDKAAAAYIDAHSPSWRNAKHVSQWQNTLKTYASPVFGSMPVASISTELVTRVLQPIWLQKTETASRLRGRIEKILDWCKVQGYREGDNPARWRGHQDKLLAAPKKVAKVAHHPALPWQEVGAFMVQLRRQPGLAAMAVEFIILTACRTSEALGAEWTEFDLDQGVWTIPKTRMKAGIEHRVPLSQAAMDLLMRVKAETGREVGYVFPGRKEGTLSNMAGLALLKRMGRSDLTVHGFRSTFRDWCSEATKYPNHIAEKALAHTIGNAVEKAYRRGDLLERRRPLMNDWAAYCSIVRKPAEVVAMPKKSAV